MGGKRPPALRPFWLRPLLTALPQINAADERPSGTAPEATYHLHPRVDWSASRGRGHGSESTARHDARRSINRDLLACGDPFGRTGDAHDRGNAVLAGDDGTV